MQKLSTRKLRYNHADSKTLTYADQRNRNVVARKRTCTTVKQQSNKEAQDSTFLSLQFAFRYLRSRGSHRRQPRKSPRIDNRKSAEAAPNDV